MSGVVVVMGMVGHKPMLLSETNKHAGQTGCCSQAEQTACCVIAAW